MIGERKALRKRIVISNTNALEVQGLRDLNVKNMMDEAQIGQMLALSGELLDQLRDVRAFKPTQNWHLFRQPSTLMRRESVELGRTVWDISAGQVQGRPRTVRRIIAGERGTGKSLMLLQAMSMAFLKDWVVINVPEGRLHSPLPVLKLTVGRSRIYDRPFCLCSYGYLCRKAVVAGPSRPDSIEAISAITGDDLQSAKTDRGAVAAYF